MIRRTFQEVLDCLGKIEASIAAVELALTRLEFALAHLPADAKLSGRSTLLETAEAFRGSLVVFSKLHRLTLEDLERTRRLRGAGGEG